jgi:hypothetical protein
LPEGLVGPDGVVRDLLGSELLAELTDGVRQVDHLVELLVVGAPGALDRAVELGGAGSQHEEQDAAFLAGALEVGLELVRLALRP